MRCSAAAFALAGVLSIPPAGDAAHAQDARVRTDLDTALISVGDRVRMSVTVEHAAGTRVSWPDTLDLSPFEVLESRILAPEARADQVRSGLVLTLTAFELGELEIPSFEVMVAGPGEASQAVSTDRFVVRVATVGVDEGGDIRDIRGPLSIPVSVVYVGLWLLPVLAVAFAAFWLYSRRGRPEAGGLDVGAPPSEPPHVIALEALARIEESPLLERGQIKEYHIQVSETLRAYVEARFGAPALEMTTREVVVGLQLAGVDPTFVGGLRRFLERCDVVKFAKGRPVAEASRTTLALGRDLVRSSTPAAPEPAPAAEDPAPATSTAAEPEQVPS